MVSEPESRAKKKWSRAIELRKHQRTRLKTAIVNLRLILTECVRYKHCT